MYFKEKEDTNIDKEFEGKRKKNSNFDINKILKNPKILLIGGGIVIAIILTIVIVLILNNKNNYTIELVGGETIIAYLDQEFVDPGIKAYDKNGNDCSEQVERTSDVDITKVGEYSILYSIGGVIKTRYVNVLEPETIIYLNGDKNMCLPLGTKFNDPGASARDSIDGDLTAEIISSGDVNHKKARVYTIEYRVTNSRGETKMEKRNVRVAEKCE